MIIPDDPRDAVTPLNADHDRPSGVHEQIGWLQAAGFRTALVWQHRDLVVLAADLDRT